MKRGKTPTISDIKYMTSVTNPHFFDRGSMKFFGQTMRNFRVRTSPKGNIFIFAKGKYNTYTFRQYVPSKKVGHSQLLNVPGNQNTLRDIETFIRNH